MKKILASFSLLLLLGASTLLCQESREKAKEKDLPPQFQQFLDLTRYIILPQEREVFLQLSADRDREAFIRTFWKQRDPTPGTDLNERKEEHMRRFNYANKTFGRQTPRQGWMTDMGRYYIILGEPTSYDRIPSSLDLYPIEVWYYHGDTSKGLPTYFALVFYIRGGVGEYKLYDPLVDGPTALMVYGRHFHPTDYEGMLDYIKERVPTLSLVTLSMIPGDIPYNYTPSVQNNLILADIIESPKKDINASYATHFLEYKGVVTVDYMENYIESSVATAIIKDPILDVNFLHFSIVPEEISIDYYQPSDQYYCNFSLTVNLKEQDNMIFQYTREFPFYFKDEDLDRIKSNGIAIEDSFPVIPGEYDMSILLQNSVGKEFSVYEAVVSTPANTGEPGFFKPILGYKTQNYRRDLHIPFKVLDQKIVIDPKNTYAVAEDIYFMLNVTDVTQALWEGGKLRVEIIGLKPVDPKTKSFDLSLRNYPYRRTLTISQLIAGDEFPPDYYEMKFFLIDEQNQTLKQDKVSFTVSPEAVVAHPIAHAKAFPHASSYLYYFAMARQFEKIQDWNNAEAGYQRAFEANPDYKQGVVDYASFLFKVSKFDQSLDLIERLQGDTEMRFQYFLTRGRALMGKELYPEAIDTLQQGNAIYNSDTVLLNSLGFCYYKMGDFEKALDALKASLALNPAQDDVKAQIVEMEKK